MFETLKNAWKIPDLRRKMLFTLAMLVIFRIGTFIPVPGLNPKALQDLLGDNALFGFIDIVTGGALKNATIFAMSITPYINSSIIMQLLTVAIPKLEQLAKEGEEGRKIIQQYVRYGTVILAFLQAVGLYSLLNNWRVVREPGLLSFITITLTFTAGTAFLMWLGEQITEFGIGNGISLLIFAGIVSRGPSGAYSLLQLAQGGAVNILGVLLIIIVFIGVIVGVIWVQQAERRIPIQYAKRVVGRKMYGGQSTHLPMKVNLAGVIPIIFAMSITLFPTQILSYIFNYDTKNWFIEGLKHASRINSPLYNSVYFLLIMFFTFFYTVIQFNPVEIANNMKKNGGFIPGIRPGKPTSDYISKVLNRITWFGALFLAVIAVFPGVASMATGTTYNLWFGGTAVLILVGVALDTVKQIESQMLMRHYKGFLE